MMMNWAVIGDMCSSQTVSVVASAWPPPCVRPQTRDRSRPRHHRLKHVSEHHRSILRSALVAGLWGAGHTASLIVVGIIVLALQVAFPERISYWLEFRVALMIIGLGMTAFMRALRGRRDVHIH
ncbi:MAG: hypothetical protein LC754_12125 [Acidobacteria bacterium]|nr:hypothetical protein [Acidobacteriota bacterium]